MLRQCRHGSRFQARVLILQGEVFLNTLKLDKLKHTSHVYIYNRVWQTGTILMNREKSPSARRPSSLSQCSDGLSFVDAGCELHCSRHLRERCRIMVGRTAAKRGRESCSSRSCGCAVVEIQQYRRYLLLQTNEVLWISSYGVEEVWSLTSN